MKRIRKLKDFFIQKYPYIFSGIIIALIIIMILSIVMKWVGNNKWNSCLSIIIGCISSFGTVSATYVALDDSEPNPEIKTEVYPINKGQFCITFINEKGNSFIRLRLVKAETIGEENKNLDPQKRSIETLPDDIKKEIILSNNITFKTLCLDKSPFNQLRNYNYEIKGNPINMNIRVQETLKLIFKTNYDDFVCVKISNDNLKFNSHFFE